MQHYTVTVVQLMQHGGTVKHLAHNTHAIRVICQSPVELKFEWKAYLGSPLYNATISGHSAGRSSRDRAKGMPSFSPCPSPILHRVT